MKFLIFFDYGIISKISYSFDRIKNIHLDMHVFGQKCITKYNSNIQDKYFSDDLKFIIINSNGLFIDNLIKF